MASPRMPLMTERKGNLLALSTKASLPVVTLGSPG
jgi:hypothetical protein